MILDFRRHKVQKIFFIFIFSICIYAIGYSATCLTSECHTDLQSFEFLHGPNAAQECEVCHMATPAEIEKHNKKPNSFVDFESPVTDGPLCIMCHDNKRVGEFIHFPVEDGDCVACHNPHGGNNKFFVKGTAEAETCFTCHENDKTNKKFVHGPVNVGECASCHDPHSSNYKFQLKFAPEELCFQCHTDKKQDLEKTVVHAPLYDGCTTCHDPHSSDAPFHLKANSQKELCFSCHADFTPEVVQTINESKYQHDPVAKGNCTECHSPHASEYGKLLYAEIKVACFECHQDIGNKVQNAKYVHGPVKESGCVACHSVHGSNNPYILYEYFPKEFYNLYQEGTYKLCFECHSDVILQEETTDVATNFRNGTENLHYRHVILGAKGRSCKACHEVHASNQPVQVRAGVPYGTGGWQLPVKYTKTDDGGTCVVGCHKPKTYNRAKRYENP